MNNIRISNHQPQDIQIRQNENQLIFVNGGGEVIGITDVKVNGNSVVENNIAYVIVPTKTSELQNNSGFLTSETDPTVPTVVKTITQADINNWNNKQNALVSGSTIKTINNESLLGSGNINIEGSSYEAGYGIGINNNIITNEITSYNDLTDLPTIPDKTSDLINDSNFVSDNELSEVAYTGSYASLSDTPTIPEYTSELINDSNFTTSNEVITLLQTKQDNLESGVNIKTVKGQSLVGAGNVTKIDNYSSSEHEIGTWIDGSTIYRQVFNIGALVDQDSLTVGTPSMPNNADVVKIYGFCTRNDHAETFPIPFSWGSTTTVTDFVGLFYDYNNKRIFIRTNRYMNNYNAYVIIEYIKTS